MLTSLPLRAPRRRIASLLVSTSLLFGLLLVSAPGVDAGRCQPYEKGAVQSATSGCFYATEPIADSPDVPSGVTLNGSDGRDLVGTIEDGGTFNGGADNDVVYYNYGTFNGGTGNDSVGWNYGTFNGGTGNDSVADTNIGTFYGGPGDDSVGDNYGTFYGGSGTDTVGDDYDTFYPGPQN